ncbi:hypothetical protein GF415_02255 [Candidatus Micrarchaeota archaeon]|nr:hypothetical protein [Candidatus Micrarchaeota archaeon]
MPARDGTGPNRLGPLTGRRMGPCGRGAGYGRGYGRGYGYGGSYYGPAPQAPPASSKEDEISYLKSALKSLDAEKKDIEQRLKELVK